VSGWTKLVERRVLISGATNDDGNDDLRSAFEDYVFLLWTLIQPCLAMADVIEQMATRFWTWVLHFSPANHTTK
jgi:hypothetical protein